MEELSENWIDDIELEDESYKNTLTGSHDDINYIVKTFRLHKWREPYSDEELQNYVLNGEYEIDKSNNVDRNYLNRKENILGVGMKSLLRSEFDDRLFEIYGDNIYRIGDFRGGSTVVVCKCNLCGSIFIENVRALLNGKGVCCLKNNTSKGERLVEKLLKENNILFKKQYSDGCINLETNRELPFDFVVQATNTTFYIEVQGKQHYEPIDFFGGDEQYKRLIYRDNIKRKYANENGVYIELDYREGDLSKLKERFEEVFLLEYKRKLGGELRW